MFFSSLAQKQSYKYNFESKDTSAPENGDIKYYIISNLVAELTNFNLKTLVISSPY